MPPPACSQVCADFTSVGGFKYELNNGMCTMRISFNDLAVKAGESNAVLVPANYKGFQWKNVAVANTTGSRPSGYVSGTASPTNVAVVIGNTLAASGEITAPTFTFDLVSVQATAAWNNGLVVSFTGYTGAAVVNTKTVTINTSGPTLINFGAGWENLDRVKVASSGGVKDVTLVGKGTHVVLDDFIVA